MVESYPANQNFIPNSFAFSTPQNNHKKQVMNNLKNRLFISGLALLFYGLVTFLSAGTNNFVDFSPILGFDILPNTMIDQIIFAALQVCLWWVVQVLALYEIVKLITKNQPAKKSFAFIAIITNSFWFWLQNGLVIALTFSDLLLVNFDLLRFAFVINITIIWLGTVCNVLSLLLMFTFAQIKVKFTTFLLLALVLLGFQILAIIGILNDWITLFYLILLALLVDTNCYLIGSFFGKNKLAPKISPNKTWEGTIFGTILGFVGVVVYLLILHFANSNANNTNSFLNPFPHAFPKLPFFDVFKLANQNRVFNPILVWSVVIGMTVVLAVMVVLGDLLFSYYKRLFQVKDFGKLLKGHGGILDRFDSLLVIASCYFCFVTIGAYFVLF